MSVQTFLKNASLPVENVPAPALPSIAAPRFAGDVLPAGFALTLAAWLTAYVCRMPVVNAGAQTTVLAMVAALFLGGFFTGRYSRRGLRTAALAGVISGILDILILGSLLTDATRGKVNAITLLLWLAGSVILNAAVAALGGLIGSALKSARRDTLQWPKIFAVILAVATLPLITAGGLVTAFRAGLAVPDWPTSFRSNMFLFPLSQMQANNGQFYEHAHRLMGALVGLTSFTLAIYLTAAFWRTFDRRAKIARNLAWIIFVCVGIQGALGGMRVVDKSIPLAIAHGIFAQLVFAAMAVLAASLGRTPPPLSEHHTRATDRLFSTTLLASLVIQLALGAFVRHTNSLVILHMSMAAVVTLLVLACGFRAWGLYPSHSAIRRTGILLLILVLLQLTLGILALIFRAQPGQDPTTRAAFLTTFHQANGALLLATAAILCFKMWQARLSAEINQT